MIGKKNIVFGFSFFVLSALLGPYMGLQFRDPGSDVNKTSQQRVSALGKVQQLQESKFRDEMDDKKLAELDKVGMIFAEAIRAVQAEISALEKLRKVRTGPHSHGNLESLLNIVVGLILFFLSAPVLVKQAISWLMISGTLLHSGLLFLRDIPAEAIPWAASILASGVGPIMILLGLVLTAISSAVWLKK